MPKTGRASSTTGCDLVSKDAGDLSKRGWELASGGDAVRGLACHEAATSLTGSGGLNWFHRARTEQQLGMDAQAIPSFQKAVEHRTLSLRANEAVEAYFQLAKLLREANGDIAGAERAYREVLRLGPERSGGHIMLGVTLREANRLAESLHHYSYGLKLHPAIPAAQFNRGQIYSSLQREGEAIACYRTALRVEPTFAIAQEQLGESLLSEGRVGEATHSLQRATRMPGWSKSPSW
tara:strand:+ start:768 stop:1475 length:708 start_codon:yes stop_codon:yes gene_type:complete